MIRLGLATVAMVSVVALAAVAVEAEVLADETHPPIVTADFNRDGIADFAEVVESAGDSSGPRSLSILLGNGDGTFRRSVATALLGRDPEAMVAGDFNHDGIPDLIVGDADGSLVELLGDGTGSFLSAGAVAHLGSITSIAVADFNHDGLLDIAVSDSRSSVVTVLLADGGGVARPLATGMAASAAFRQVWSFQLPARGKVYHLAAADFNHDGLPDLAVTNDDDPSYQVMLNNGNGTFTYAPQLSKVVDPNAHCAT